MDVDVYGCGKEKVVSIKKSIVSGVKWTTLSTSLVTGIQAFQLIVLARLLKPEDFGLMAMAMVVIGFCQAYADMGISAAIVYKQDVSESQLSSLYWLNVIAGIVIYSVILAVTPFVTIFFHEPRVGEVLPVIAISIIISSLGLQFHWLLEKGLQFDLLAKQEITSTVIAGMVAIPCAFMGQGVWSLVWGQLTASGVKTVLLLKVGLSKWPPRLHLRTNDLGEYLKFGMYQMAERSINYFNTKVDQLLIGNLLGAHELGYYNFAFQLVSEPVSRINPILTRVAFPVFARMQGEVLRLQQGYIKVVNLLSSTNAPLLIGLAAVAPLLVPAIFGSQWTPAVMLVQILALYSFVRSTGNPIGSLLLARGRADLGFRWNLGLFFITAPSVYLGARIGGPTGIALTLLLLQIFYSIIGYVLLVAPMVGNCVKPYARSILKPTILALIMGSWVWLLSLSQFNSTPWLAFEIITGGCLYMILLWYFDRDLVIELKDILRRAD